MLKLRARSFQRGDKNGKGLLENHWAREAQKYMGDS
jgi:hypothetical protein